MFKHEKKKKKEVNENVMLGMLKFLKNVDRAFIYSYREEYNTL